MPEKSKMGKKQKNNSAYNGAPTDKKETVYKNDTNDEYVYENGQYESAHEEMAAAMERTDRFPVFIRL